MKTVEIKLYQFSELSAEAKVKAVEQYRYFNVEYIEWWDFIYDDFTAICATIGITVKPGTIFFRGFYSQGDGSCFNADINLTTLFKGVETQAWTDHAPIPELKLPTFPLRKVVTKLITERKIECFASIQAPRRCMCVNSVLEFFIDNYPHIEKQFGLLEQWLEQVAESLNHFLYKALEKEYEWCLSDEAIIETITANEYLFTKDGKKANHLLSLEG
jgi:hypothetical protein